MNKSTDKYSVLNIPLVISHSLSAYISDTLFMTLMILSCDPFGAPSQTIAQWKCDFYHFNHQIMFGVGRFFHFSVGFVYSTIVLLLFKLAKSSSKILFTKHGLQTRTITLYMICGGKLALSGFSTHFQIAHATTPSVFLYFELTPKLSRTIRDVMLMLMLMFNAMETHHS